MTDSSDPIDVIIDIASGASDIEPADVDWDLIAERGAE